MWMPCWQFAEVTHVQDNSLQRESILKYSHTRSSLCRCSSHCQTPWQQESGESQLRGSGSVGLQEDQIKAATARWSVHKACTHTYTYTCTKTHTHTHTHKYMHDSSHHQSWSSCHGVAMWTRVGDLPVLCRRWEWTCPQWHTYRHWSNSLSPVIHQQLNVIRQGGEGEMHIFTACNVTSVPFGAIMPRQTNMQQLELLYLQLPIHVLKSFL